MLKQPGHLTSMKKERGAGTSCYSKKIPPLVAEYHNYPNSTPSYLKLVLAGLSLRGGVEKVDRENLCEISC